jgi:hypothetical protein
VFIVVIIFDVHWNPSVDMQSQDRAYRIGQTENVSVFRLVAKGTVEEVIYMRQLYKQELQKQVLRGEDSGTWGGKGKQASSKSEKMVRIQSLASPAGGGSTQDGSSSTSMKRMTSRTPSSGRQQFEGIQGDAACRGELFGIGNLMQFSKGSILESIREKLQGAGQYDDSEDDEELDEDIVGEHDGDGNELSRLLLHSEHAFTTSNKPAEGEIMPDDENANTNDSEATMDSEDLNNLLSKQKSPAKTTTTTGSTLHHANGAKPRRFQHSRRKTSMKDVLADAMPATAVLDFIRTDMHIDDDIIDLT